MPKKQPRRRQNGQRWANPKPKSRRLSNTDHTDQRDTAPPPPTSIPASSLLQNASPSFPVKSKGEKGPRVSGEAFKRVDAEVWSKEIIEGLEDNSYEKAFGTDGYGAKASAVLMTVRGKDFRHEKTKKKRGSYRGGDITLASNSYKYTD